MSDSTRGGVELKDWTEPGYRPLIFSDDWQVAILNWESGADLNHLQWIEKHNHTDEVFILLSGKATLITEENGSFHLFEGIPGRVLNVLSGTWHTVIGYEGCSWVIVEKKDTHLNDVEKRELTHAELERIRLKL